MKTKTVIVKLIAAAVMFSALKYANAGVVSSELVPATDLFSWVSEPDPYYITLRELLIGEHRYRKCQIVAIPSFEKEWAVYLVRNNGETQLHVKIMAKHLWSEMSREMSDDGKRRSYSLGSKSQSNALSKLPKEVERHSILISEETADILEEAWEVLLSRVKYKDNSGFGLDGTTYHISHWSSEIGFRSGTTWSPDEGTFPADLVAIGYSLKELVVVAKSERKSHEQQIEIRARRLIKSANQQVDPIVTTPVDEVEAQGTQGHP